MSWVTVIWSMMIASCLTLAVVHALVGMQRRKSRANLIFSLMAVGTALLAVAEMWMMRAPTPEDFAVALRWLHVPAWILVLAVVAFVRVYLDAGRRWLAWTVCGLRTLSLILNFTVGLNLNYLQITAIRRIPFLGESVSVAEGVRNPLMLLGQLSLVLTVIFANDAAVTVWRRGGRRQAVTVGGGVVIFTVMACSQAVLILWGILPLPLSVSVFYLGMLSVTGFELSRNMIRAADLSERLRESEQQMILAAEAANLGVWTRHFEGETIWATDKWREMFGFGKSVRLELDAILERVHPDDREGVHQALMHAVNGEGLYEKEHRLLLPDERTGWVSSRGRVEFDGSGKPILIRGVSLDITGQKRAEAENRQHRNEVAHLSRVAMLGELSGSLAHELNQPLTVILSNAQAALRFLNRPEVDRAELAEILHDIVDADRYAGEVIRRLRFLLKKGEVQRQPLDVNAIILDVLKLMRSDLLNHHISVETELTPHSPKISGDQVQLQQVLLNLMMNASDAMAGKDESNRRLHVGTAVTADRCLRIYVRDSGRGIPAEELERVFQPYYTTKDQGLGLGLSVCRSIIQAHHGELTAENHPDGGAVFHFRLPLEEEARHS